jgi:hypothetical protein
MRVARKQLQPKFPTHLEVARPVTKPAVRAAEADRYERIRAKPLAAAASSTVAMEVPAELTEQVRALIVAQTGVSRPLNSVPPAAPAPRAAPIITIPGSPGFEQTGPVVATSAGQIIGAVTSMVGGYYVPMERQAPKYPPQLANETLAQFALRTAAVTGLPVNQLGALLHMGFPGLPANASHAERVDAYMHPTAYWSPGEIDRQNRIIYEQSVAGIGFSPGGAKPPALPPPPSYGH